MWAKVWKELFAPERPKGSQERSNARIASYNGSPIYGDRWVKILDPKTSREFVVYICGPFKEPEMSIYPQSIEWADSVSIGSPMFESERARILAELVRHFESIRYHVWVHEGRFWPFVQERGGSTWRDLRTGHTWFEKYASPDDHPMERLLPTHWDAPDDAVPVPPEALEAIKSYRESYR